MLDECTGENVLKSIKCVIKINANSEDKDDRDDFSFGGNGLAFVGYSKRSAQPRLETNLEIKGQKFAPYD